MNASLARLHAIAEALDATSGLPSPHTVASYTRRWRQWDAFADRYGVNALPADPDHVAAFALSRLEAEVSVPTVEANLSAVRWVHERLADFPEVTDLARLVVRQCRQHGDAKPTDPAPVLSLGAVLAMASTPDPRSALYSAKVLRWWLPDILPRQLGQIRPSDVDVSPDGESAEIHLHAMRAAGRSPYLPAQTVTLRRTPGRLECPVRAVLSLMSGVSPDEPILTPNAIKKSGLAGFDPADGDATAVLLGARNRALICVGYAGALRVEEIAQIRAENLTPHPKGLHLRLVNTKTADDDAVLLLVRDDALDPVAAINEWMELRGWDDGPLFDVVHHRSKTADVYDGITAEAARRIIAKQAALVGLDGAATGHSLRRSWATHTYLADRNAFARISKHLRHANMSVTDRYISDIRLLGDAANELLDPAVISTVGSRPPARKNLGFVERPLDELVADAKAAASAEQAFAPSTRHGDRSYWTAWTQFATSHDVPALPANHDDLAAFFAERAVAGQAASTLRGALGAVRRAHRHYGYFDENRFVTAKAVIEGHERLEPRAAIQAPILSTADLAQLAHTAARDGDLIDRIIVTVGYAGALRADDLRRCRLDDIEDHPCGALLKIRTSKLNQRGHRREVVLLSGRDDELDPIRVIHEARQRPGGPHGDLLALTGAERSISANTVRERLQRLAKKANLDTRPSGHSLRRSWATHAYENGSDVLEISRHLRHLDPEMTLRYIEGLSPWPDNAAAQLVTDPASDNTKGGLT